MNADIQLALLDATRVSRAGWKCLTSTAALK